uniref:SH2 domain-containing protein n=1 Tax=Panagrolaimus davidi TaxID=227884 RepID=A0A914Q9C4_9BILA
MALSDRIEFRILQSDIINPAASIQNITNIYLNMDDLRRINPYNSNQMYPGVSEIPETLKPKKPEVKKVFELSVYPETHENEIEEEEDYGYGEGYAEDNIGSFATAPPIRYRLYVPQQPSQNYYAHPSPAPVPQFRHPDATVRHPSVRSQRENNYDSEIERLKQKEKQLQERIRQVETENQKVAQQIEIPPLPPRRKRRVEFRTIKEALQFRAQKMAQDSEVRDSLFVFPEAPENSLHWTNRLFRREKKLHLSREQFIQLSEYLKDQPWFHGTIHRMLAESRLVKNGEFLLRQSTFQPGQFILSVLRYRIPHHNCLVNQEGQIRSHARKFTSVIHLIQFHFTTSTPICSKSSAILLRIPVPRPKFIQKVTH